MTHIIVNRIHPLYYYGFRLLIILIIILLLWGAFKLGYRYSEELMIESKGGHHSLLVQQHVLKKQNSELSKKLLHLERKYLLNKQSCQLIQFTMNEDQQKIAQLENKLAFYKGIVAPTKERESIYLQSLEMIPNQQPNSYQFQFILAQKIKQRKQTKGKVQFYLKGKKNNKKIKLLLTDLIIDISKQKEKVTKYGFAYNFKYFQKITTIIKLPKKLIPQSIEVIFTSKQKKLINELNDIQWSQTKGMKYVGK
jgi:hypothetical protein